MCGIGAVLSYAPGRPVDPGHLDTMCVEMRRRGPDGAGTWIGAGKRVGLAHTRLSIIGLGQQGAQPMALAEPCGGRRGPLVISYNGEIYNYRALRVELERLGHRFRSTSDTEVLLHLYEEHGDAMVERLRGMFAFALWDEDRRALVLVRDAYGIKPLYLSATDDRLLVASQAKTLLACGASRTPSEAGVAGFFVLGSVPKPHTAWRDIEALPAGTMEVVGLDGVRSRHRWYSHADLVCAAEVDRSEPTPDLVRGTLAGTVDAHLTSDVEVGTFLSAGIDSGVITALASERSDALRAFTLGFEEFTGSTDDETPLARQVAGTYGVEHDVEVVTAKQFTSYLPAILSAMDQPSVDGVNTWLVSNVVARAGVRSALSGVGGDEVLGGYPTFRRVPRWSRWLRAAGAVPGPERLAPLLLRLRPSVHPKMRTALRHGRSVEDVWLLQRAVFLPEELAHVLGRERAESALAALDLGQWIDALLHPRPRTAVGVVAALEAQVYLRNQLLRDADWAGMSHSLEIRVPFVDVEVARELMPALVHDWARPRTSGGKAAALATARRPLPAEVGRRTKTGFSVPLERWLAEAPDLQSWRSVPYLAEGNVPWARRWAYAVADRFALV